MLEGLVHDVLVGVSWTEAWEDHVVWSSVAKLGADLIGGLVVGAREGDQLRELLESLLSVAEGVLGAVAARNSANHEATELPFT